MKPVKFELLLLIILIMLPLSSCVKSEKTWAADNEYKILNNYRKLQQARMDYDVLCAQEVETLIETVLNKYDGLTENQKRLVCSSGQLIEIEIDAIGEIKKEFVVIIIK